MTAPAILRVALPVPLPRLFDYLPPPGLEASAVAVGARLRVPFGQREVCGLVVGHGLAEPGVELRAALAAPDGAPLLQGELLASLRWLAAYLHAPLGEVLAAALPAALRRGEPLPDITRHGWVLNEAGRTALAAMRAGKPKALAGLLVDVRDEDWLDATSPGWRTPLRALRERGLVERVAETGSGSLPRGSGPDPVPSAFSPNTEQQVAIDAIRSAEGFAPFLLDGVTGSGKTEVYLQAIADCLARGRQALVLVPEIGLTPQALARFRARLGVPVHALHSGLTDSERAATWLAAASGQAQVIVGTRSAVFVPLPEAGLIVVDEEHDGSYKQFDGIRYHARDFAIVRARALAVPVVLGSATPSLETLHNAQSGRYALLRLRRRAGDARPPQVRVLDVRKRPLHAGLSEESLAAIRAALDAGGQVLVFRNRRGYAPVLLCHDCGWSAHCPRCSTPERPTAMTVHAHGKRLQCHHCGHRRPSPPACPDCASLALQPQGNGTERIEAELQARFDAVPVIRIDRGSTGQRDGLQKHLDALGNRPGILIGTQMLAKGHDLGNLVLVVVVGIDEGLFSADFRSGEKLAQLLIQVAGRAGRADRPGTVLLQTHHPEHPLLQTLVGGGYHAFADGELALREAAGFPPFAHLALLRAEAKRAELPLQFLQLAKTLLDSSAIEVHGPLPAPMPRRAGFVRSQLLLAAPARAALHAALDVAVPALYAAPDARRVRWSLDVDPLDLY
ncbi:primosomal protein N' [Thermomonas sp. XSG]|jgi:primosomal protein N' (replication factor Y)|uniref:primosomal protein N' n=1 Tax=Thermomonas sp. XSG TaxID=2771436 RepID=UPI001680B1B1|nr:primosomal protein N' [Thermomonas sp. XSG]QNU15257.1 primosomal protein N' [Thermomonas sp. XSG]